MDEAEKARGGRAGTPRRMTEPQDLPQGLMETSHRSTQKRTMKLNEPSAELDLAVAKAVGLKNPRIEVACLPLTPYPRCCVYEDDAGAVQETRNFLPSRDMTDAWKAAEKITDAIRSRNRLASLTPQSLFTLQHFGHGGWCARISPQNAQPVKGFAPTGPLAICAAILALKEKL